MADFIPYTKHDITPADIEAVINVLKNHPLTQGPKAEEFEHALSDAHNVSYATVTSSGTSALHLAYAALGLGPQDVLVTTPISFCATSNAALYCGAQVVFSDIDPETWNLSAQALEKTLQSLSEQKKNVKIVVAVHLGGLLCEIDKLAEVTKKYFPHAHLVEDSSHAIGILGVCSPYSSAAVLSLHPAKHVAVGEGGAVLTRDKVLHERCQILRSHGITKDSSQFRYPEQSGPWYHEMQFLGWNYRLSDIACGLGLSQLSRLKDSLQKRKECVDFYSESLQKKDWIQIQKTNNAHAYHLCMVRIKYKTLGFTRTVLMESLKARGIGTQVHYIPTYKMPYYKDVLKQSQTSCPEAESYYAEALSLPMYASLKKEQIQTVLHALFDICKTRACT